MENDANNVTHINVSHINEKYCIKRTGANIVLVEKKMVDTGDNKGSINYINKGYYSTFEGLLFGLTKQYQQELCDCGDLPKAVDEIKKHMRDCVVAISKMKLGV